MSFDPYAAPAAPTPPPPGKVRFGPWISAGWDLFRARWQTWVGATAILIAPFALLYMAMLATMFGSAARLQAGQMPADGQLPFSMTLIGFWFLLFPLVWLWMLYGYANLYRMAARQMRGESISVKDLFRTDVPLVKLLGVGFLVALMAFAGMLLCILPGLVVLGLTSFAVPMVVLYRMGPVEAIKRSIDATKGDWFMFTLFTFVVGFLSGLGVYACGVGILVTYPLAFTIGIVAFNDTFGLPETI